MLRTGVFLIVLTCSVMAGKSQVLAGLDTIALPAVDSSSLFSLGKLHGKQAVVLVFTGNHCVYSKKYEDRLMALSREFAKENVSLVLVNSNAPELSPDDRLELMESRAREKKYPMPYLQDSQGRLAKLVGATKNPEAFVLVFKGGVWLKAYAGKIDDNPLMESNVEKNYLREAVRAVLSGQVPSSTQPAMGCGVKQW